MATAHSLPVVLPSVHPKAAPALPTAAELPQPTEHSRARARTSDTRLRLRSPSTPALLGRAPGGSASPRGTRRFPGDTALPGERPGAAGQRRDLRGDRGATEGQGCTCQRGIIAGSTARPRLPGTVQPGTRSARGTCEGTAAIREGPSAAHAARRRSGATGRAPRVARVGMAQPGDTAGLHRPPSGPARARRHRPASGARDQRARGQAPGVPGVTARGHR